MRVEHSSALVWDSSQKQYSSFQFDVFKGAVLADDSANHRTTPHDTMEQRSGHIEIEQAEKEMVAGCAS